MGYFHTALFLSLIEKQLPKPIIFSCDTFFKSVIFLDLRGWYALLKGQEDFFA